ncbi:MAG: TetR family transcriptional regulator [Candidatus Eiseniibacteriota bacterium]
MDAPSAPRLALRKNATRERIVREAFELFGRQGFESTTVETIVGRADVAKGTFFNYFPRKEALVTHLFERRLRAAVANATDLIGIGIPVRDKLLDLYTEAAAGHEDDSTMTRRLLAAEAARALGAAGGPDFARAWNDVVLELVRQGQRSGELRAALEPLQACRVLNAVYLAVLEAWAARNSRAADSPADAPVRAAIPELRAAVREHLALVLDGLGA